MTVNLKPTRRTFISTTAVTAASYQRILGANNRVQIGLIGFGLIGGEHMSSFKQHSDSEFAGICDVYAPRVEAGLAATGNPNAKGYKDFREMLDNKDIQGVVVATPDHWHALMTMMACAAGKDVYVEKPMTLFPAEGRWMVNVARKYNRVVQVGTQQRSGKHYQEARDLIQSGYLGRVHTIWDVSARNVMPGFGAPMDGDPPPELDYNMWLGPAPQRMYNLHRSLYHFRWFSDYSGGQMTNLGQHSMDIVHFFMNVRGPNAVSCSGGRFALVSDNGNTPDTQESVWEYPGGGWSPGPQPGGGGGTGFLVRFSFREACAGTGGGFQFCGTRASLTINRSGFQVRGERRVHPANLIPAWSSPPGHPQGNDEPATQWAEDREGKGNSDEQMLLHTRNFLDCIKSRERPIADVEDGHEVVTACHLANISMWVGRKLKWDQSTEQIIGDPEANAYLMRPYRSPWDEVLKSLIS